jgi:ATP-dependent protease ClpP protease subunit
MNPLGPFVDYDSRVLSLLGRIEQSHIDALADQLLRLDAARRSNIILYVSSQGGNIHDALKITDILDCLRSKVTVIGMGHVQGAGLIILSCASERLVLPSCIFSTAGLFDFEFRQATSLIEALEPRISALGKSSKELSKLIRSAAHGIQFLSANQAMELNLIDSIYAIPPSRKPSLIGELHGPR